MSVFPSKILQLNKFTAILMIPHITPWLWFAWWPSVMMTLESFFNPQWSSWSPLLRNDWLEWIEFSPTDYEMREDMIENMRMMIRVRLMNLWWTEKWEEKDLSSPFQLGKRPPEDMNWEHDDENDANWCTCASFPPLMHFATLLLLPFSSFSSCCLPLTFCSTWSKGRNPRPSR